MEKHKFTTIDEYHAAFPEQRPLLEQMRAAIRAAAPEAKEVIGYNMPAFKMKGVLVYYAAGKAHIGFYPTPSPMKAFAEELKPYKTSKAAIQFPFKGGIPTDLVKRIVRFRLEEDAAKAKKK